MGDERAQATLRAGDDVRAGLQAVAEAIKAHGTDLAEAMDAHAMSIDAHTRAIKAVAASIETAGNEIAGAILSAAPRSKPERQRLMSTKEVMARMGWSRSTLWRRVADGQFPAPEVARLGHSKAYLKDEVEKAVARAVYKSDQPPPLNQTEGTEP